MTTLIKDRCPLHHGKNVFLQWEYHKTILSWHESILMSWISNRRINVPLTFQSFFHINKLSLLPWLLWRKRFLTLNFSFRMLYPFKPRKLGTFLAHGRQSRRMGPVYFVTSSQGDKYLFSFTECLVRVLFLDVTTKVNTEYLFLTIIARSEWEEREKMDRFYNHSLFALFVPWANETLTWRHKVS